jgi:hypothetical protein
MTKSVPHLTHFCRCCTVRGESRIVLTTSTAASSHRGQFMIISLQMHAPRDTPADAQFSSPELGRPVRDVAGQPVLASSSVAARSIVGLAPPLGLRLRGPGGCPHIGTPGWPGRDEPLCVNPRRVEVGEGPDRLCAEGAGPLSRRLPDEVPVGLRLSARGVEPGGRGARPGIKPFGIGRMAARRRWPPR